jgi:hypothetical protein
MKNNKLTERKVKNLVKKTINESDDTEINEILGLDNLYHGLRGVYQGEGYDYYRFLNKLKNRSSYLEFALNYAENEFNYLKSLYEKIQNVNFNPEKKKSLLALIEPIITKWESCFKPISDNVNEIKQMVSDKLSNKIDDIKPEKQEPKNTTKKDKKNSNIDNNPPNDPNQRNSGNDINNQLPPINNNGNNQDNKNPNEPNWDDTIKEEIKRIKDLLK